MQFDLKSVFVSLLVASASAAPVELENRAVSAKKGLAYNNGKLANLFKGAASWGYSWGTAPAGLDASIEFVPMIHGAKDDVNTFIASLKGAKNMLGYNEPDQMGGGGTADEGDVTAVAKAWNALRPKIPAGVKVGGPAVTSAQNQKGKGLDYLGKWIKAVGGAAAAKVDFQPLHYYGGGEDVNTQAKLLQKYLTDAHTMISGKDFYGKDTPIWLTEFAAGPPENVQMQADFLKLMIPWLEQQSFIARYSPLKVDEGYLVHNNAKSASGATFAG